MPDAEEEDVPEHAGGVDVLGRVREQARVLVAGHGLELDVDRVVQGPVVAGSPELRRGVDVVEEPPEEDVVGALALDAGDGGQQREAAQQGPRRVRRTREDVFQPDLAMDEAQRVDLLQGLEDVLDDALDRRLAPGVRAREVAQEVAVLHDFRAHVERLRVPVDERRDDGHEAVLGRRLRPQPL